jgi:hypothetical protein
MPLLKPTPKEDRKDFIARCIRNPKMISEFPDADQRFAVCVQQSKTETL